MALAIDASSPVAVQGSAANPLTTSSFNPPANSLIVVIAEADNDGGTASASVSDNQGHTYTRYARSNSGGGTTEVWGYYTTSALSSLTVTTTFTNGWNQPNTGLMNVLVFTGASSTQPGATSTNASNSIALTPNAIGSYIVGGYVSVSSSVTPSANANTTLLTGVNGGGGFFTLAGWHSTNTTSSLSSVTYGLTNGGGSQNSVAVEILEDTSGGGAPTVPTVSTFAATNITPTTATGNGAVEDDGGDTITERGVCWSTSPLPTTSDNKATAAGTTGPFDVEMTGLSNNTTYHMRAYAINSVGTAYGPNVTMISNGGPVVWIQQ